MSCEHRVKICDYEEREREREVEREYLRDLRGSEGVRDAVRLTHPAGQDERDRFEIRLAGVLEIGVQVVPAYASVFVRVT